MNFALSANQPAEVALLGATSGAPNYSATATGSVYAVFYCPDAATCANVLPQLLYSALPTTPWSLSAPISWDTELWTQWSAEGIDDSGARRRFKMNRKCAAGTGAFLEEIAAHLDIPLATLNSLASQATGTLQLGSFCTVFAKTELLKLVAQGAPLPEIAKAAFRSVVKRILEMDPLSGQVVMTGGVVAHNPVIVELLSEALGRAVLVPDHPQYTGALGAALLAADA